MRFALLCLVFSAACGPSNKVDNSCTGSETRCTDNAYEVCVDGKFAKSEDCTNACAEDLGCVTCVPGEGTCEGDGNARVCKPDGSGWETEFCDVDLGLACGASGRCEGACSRESLGGSYIGCEYFSTVTSNEVLLSGDFDFAVVISNPSNETAVITITGGSLNTAREFEVAPDEVHSERLPLVPYLSACRDASCQFFAYNTSEIVKGGAYHIKSTTPITVYQFNPLDYTNGNEYSYSNDASLLIPSNAMGDDFLVSSYPGQHYYPDGFHIPTDPFINRQGKGYPGLIAITATEDDTEVSFTPSSTTYSGSVPTTTAGQTRTITLDRGDVAQVLSDSGDLTGSRVTANKRINVTGGHHCAFVPSNRWACDHIEETMFPIGALATEYVTATPRLPTNAQRDRLVRIIATANNTSLTYDPAPPGAPTEIINAGQFIEISTAMDFKITASQKVIVAEYMLGAGNDPNNQEGDPSMALAIPTEQFRLDYQFLAPTNYQNNYVNIIAPLTSTVTLDGNTISNFSQVGATDFGIAKVELSNAGTGAHRASSNTPFGISVYGYGNYTTYWYPGGLDLDFIPVE